MTDKNPDYIEIPAQGHQDAPHDEHDETSHKIQEPVAPSQKPLNQTDHRQKKESSQKNNSEIHKNLQKQPVRPKKEPSHEHLHKEKPRSKEEDLHESQYHERPHKEARIKDSSHEPDHQINHTKTHHTSHFKAGRLIALLALVVIIIAIVLIVRKPAVSTENVAAVVNGESISLQEFDDKYSKIPPSFQSVLDKSAFLEQLIEERLLLQAAKKEGIRATPEAVEDEIQRTLTEAGLTKEEFFAGLSGQSVTEEDLFSAAQQQLIITTYFDTVLDTEVTDEEVESYYTENRELFSIPERVQASHILISNQSRDDATAKAAAIALRRGPIIENFTVAALEYSEDPGSAQRGGDLGLFARGQMVPSFENSAFSLGIGEVSEVIPTQFGYHIIKVTDKQEAQDQSLEDVSEQLSLFLKQQKLQEQAGTLIEQLRADAAIEIVWESDVIQVGEA